MFQQTKWGDDKNANSYQQKNNAKILFRFILNN